MRIVHTSDWHAGRVFKRLDRLPELADVLEHLGDWLERERTDLLLMSGDVFDGGAPPAEAERLVFGFFKRVGRAGVHTVVIGGNHDSPARLEAWGGLAELVNVAVVARPRAADRGGLLRIETRSGETALVAAVPFASPRDLVSGLQMAEDDTKAKQAYADTFKRMVENVTTPFHVDAVNLLLLHTHLEGAAFSGSERTVHLGDEWAAAPQALPATAHYIALGHIHRPQRVKVAPAPAYYAGSPLQLDFGEAGEEKSFVSIEARPRQPVRCDRVPYQGGRPLLRVRHTLPEIEVEASRLAGSGWLWVSVPLETPDLDIGSKVRKLLPNALRVEVELPKAEAAIDPDRPRAGASHLELFEAYSRRQHQAPPSPDLVAAFQALRAECET
ncbi:MAG TPA: exonuclease SbcCD subunit D [Vicinamibacteria bacterium]|nr:exonuclease SbcCD subunit D [Vicinamibacteria bacterium]